MILDEEQNSNNERELARDANEWLPFQLVGSVNPHMEALEPSDRRAAEFKIDELEKIR